MAGLISVLIILVSLLLILVVLIQNSKGGGLASSFAASNQVMGVRKTTDFLEKSTWTLAAVLVVLCLISSMTRSGGDAVVRSITQEKAESSAPVAPALSPETTPSE